MLQLCGLGTWKEVVIDQNVEASEKDQHCRQWAEPQPRAQVWGTKETDYSCLQPLLSPSEKKEKEKVTQPCSQKAN